MGYNIGPKIGIEGEAQFRQQIKAINNEYKTLQAQTKALTAEFDKNNDEQGKLQMQGQQLEKQIDNQKRAIEEMEKALKQAEVTTGADSDAVVTWQRKLYEAQANVANLEKELQETESALEGFNRDVEQSEEALEDAGKGASQFGDILGGNLVADAVLDGLRELASLAKEVVVDSVEAAADLRAEAAQFTQTFGEMKQSAVAALEDIEDQTGISATRIKGNFSTVYAFARTMGSETEDALDIASRAMVAAADSAAYYDKTVEEVTETIQAYIKGNYANDAALGIASTETTRNAAALERYGKAFKELTESQKVDTLLAMVEAGNKASGAMGQAAREAAEWTNVTGELDDAWQQFLAVLGDPILDATVPLIQDITESLRELAEVSPGEQLQRDMQDFAETLEETEAAYNSTAASAMATATVASRYAEQLAALEQQGLATTEAHAKYESLVQQLNTLIPELNLTINEQTGLINQNTQALLGDIEAWKDLAIQQALYEKMQGQLEAYGKAQLTVAEAQQKLNTLTAPYNVDLQKLSDTLGISGAAYLETAKAAQTGTAAAGALFYVYDKDGKKLAEFSSATKGVTSETMSLANSLIKQRVQLNELNSEITAAEEIVEGYENEMDRLTGLIAENTDETGENAEAQQEQAAAIAQTQAALLELKEGYEAAKQSTRAMLDTSIGLWSEIRSESDWTAKKVLQNWRDQMKAFDDYAANLKKAKEMGIADGIIDALSDGSQESMQILDAMVNQTDYSVGEINAAFTDLGLAKDNAADALMGLDETFQDAYEDLVADAKEAGVAIVDGMAQAIRENTDKVADALADLPTVQAEAEALVAAQSQQAARYEQNFGQYDKGQVGKVENTFNITQLPGESGEEFAERVAQYIQDDYNRKAGGLGG